MKKLFFNVITLSILLISLVLSACTSAKTTPSGQSSPAGLKVVRVAIDNAPAEAGIILADKLGYFQEQGIKINFVKFASGTDELSSLASGQVDVSRGVISAGLFNAEARGVDLKLTADGGQNLPDHPYFALVINKKLQDKVKDYKDLKGLRIGIASEGSINELFLDQALEKGGLTTKDITKVVVDSFPDLLTGVANGAMDAAVQIEPLITQGVQNGTYVWWKNAKEYAPNEEISVIMYGEQLIKDKELGNKFMIAYLKGVRAYNDALINGNKDRDKVINILTKETFVNDKNVFSKMNVPFLDPNGTVPQEGVANDQNFYMKKGLVKQQVKVENIIDNSYLENSLKVVGEYKK